MKHTQLSVGFEQETLSLVKKIAKKKHSSLAHVVRELVASAINDLREEQELAKIIKKRDVPHAKKVSHEELRHA